MGTKAAKMANPISEVKEAMQRGARKIVAKAVKRAVKNEFKLLALNTKSQVREVKRAVKKAVKKASKTAKKKRSHRARPQLKQSVRRARPIEAVNAASLSLKGY